MSLGAPQAPEDPARRGTRISAAGLGRRLAGGRRILSEVSLGVEPGEVVAVVGGSGAGKTTLLEVLAGIVAPDEGRVLYDGVELHEHLDGFRVRIGYVPQDDIIHTELPLERTLRYAAALRMPPRTTDEAVTRAVRTSMSALGLEDHGATRVGALSGGQRKRASIAVELLNEPGVFFLDEPTSGLDPATSASLLKRLRDLASTGATVVFTTHAVQDLAHCDRIVFLAPGGIVAFVGTLPDAMEHLGARDVEQIYERLSSGDVPVSGNRGGVAPSEPGAGTPPDPPERPGAVRQFRTLVARTVETLVRNKLTLAILLGSPAMVVAMFAILFRPGAFDVAQPQPSAIVMIIFWITFGAFFFGLTYGLLQIVVERPILRRERLAGLSLGAYLMSKLIVMLPFLAIVNVVMLAVLGALDRLPSAGFGTYASVGTTLTLLALAALTLGLLASAAVQDASQATLALPMLCFPAVLFSGAILPVHIMATAGTWIAAAMPSRWAFEGVGHDLGIRDLLAEGGSSLGPPLLETYGDAGLYATSTYWLILAGFALAFLVGARLVLGRTAERPAR